MNATAKPFRLMLALFMACFAALPARAADDYPSKPIRVIVPFPAGSSADLRTRQLAPLVGERLKQQIIIENRVGAAGNIGTAVAAKSAPDGYTVTYIMTTTIAVNPHVYSDSGFDPLKDLLPFIATVRSGAILTVRAQSPIRSVKDLIERAKAAPGKLTFGSSGQGSPQHLMGERLKKMAGIDLMQVPSRATRRPWSI
jgi:tripartite-type tricarboxylate transporter receptor subunit TctC